MKHKHAEIIKAWADGAKIQYKWSGEWCDWKAETAPEFNPLKDYRIKPEKPEIQLDHHIMTMNLRFTIEKDGALMKFIDVELIK